MDIKGLINNKVELMLSEKSIETLIESKIEETITKAITDSIGGYKTRDILEKKFEDEISSSLKDINLKAYNQLILEQFKAVISQLQTKEYADKVEEEFKQVFICDNEPIKLSTLFEEVREHFKDDADSDKFDEHFTLIIEDDESDRSFRHIKIYFDEDPDEEKYECDFVLRFSVYLRDHEPEEDLITDLSSVKLGSISFNYSKNTISTIGYMNKIEKKLLNAYLNKTKFILDVLDADDVDTSLSDADY